MRNTLDLTVAVETRGLSVASRLLYLIALLRPVIGETMALAFANVLVHWCLWSRVEGVSRRWSRWKRVSLTGIEAPKMPGSVMAHLFDALLCNLFHRKDWIHYPYTDDARQHPTYCRRCTRYWYAWNEESRR